MTSDDPQPRVTQPQAAPAAPRRWSGRRTVAAVAVAVGVAAAGGAAIAGGAAAAGATGASGPGYGYGYGAPGEHGPGGRGWPGGLGGPGLGRALHGEFVVSDGDGGYVTRLSQQGRATAVGDTSITVVSDDGHTATYSITDATTKPAAAIAVDATVMVVADESNVALVIRDAAQRPAGKGDRPGRGPGGRGGEQDGQQGSEAPETSAPEPTR